MTHVGKPNVLGKRGYAHSEAKKKGKCRKCRGYSGGKSRCKGKKTCAGLIGDGLGVHIIVLQKGMMHRDPGLDLRCLFV